ncbi:MAG: arsenate reductase family protein [Candidatus Korobacteraceae bacterium]
MPAPPFFASGASVQCGIYDSKMKEKVTVYEKPTCTKCREVRKVLSAKGVDFEPINYFDQPLSASKLKELLRQAGMGPRDALRKNEDAYKKYVAGKELSDDQLIRLMAEHPDLLQRPIVVRGKKAVLARPTEKLSDLGL